MSRHGLSDDMDDNFAYIRWRGQVASAIRGKRGQALFRELESALVALPSRRLCAGAFADGEDVCTLGAALFKRRVDRGHDGLAAIESLSRVGKRYEDSDASTDYAAAKFDCAEQALKEIQWYNDECGRWQETPEQRYVRMLEWVRSHLAAPAVAK